MWTKEEHDTITSKNMHLQSIMDRITSPSNMLFLIYNIPVREEVENMNSPYVINYFRIPKTGSYSLLVLLISTSMNIIVYLSFCRRKCLSSSGEG